MFKSGHKEFYSSRKNGLTDVEVEIQGVQKRMDPQYVTTYFNLLNNHAGWNKHAGWLNSKN